MMKKNILVLCTGNSCRSQMLHGWLNHFDRLGEGRLNVFSAGIETHGVNPNAIAVMKQVGIDLSGHTSNHIDEYRDIDFDTIITVCDHARENCPWFPSNAKRIHRSFPDPAQAQGSEAEVMQAFRSVRDDIRAFAEQFLSQPKI